MSILFDSIFNHRRKSRGDFSLMLIYSILLWQT